MQIVANSFENCYNNKKNGGNMKLNEIKKTKNKLEFSMLCLEKLNHVPSDTSFRNWADGTTNPGGVYIPLLKEYGVTDV